MAGRSSSESEDEVKIEIPKIPRRSFSIDDLLGRPDPRVPVWPRVQPFFQNFPPKQVCPLPPNISVPPNLFARFSRREETNADEEDSVRGSEPEEIVEGSKEEGYGEQDLGTAEESNEEEEDDDGKQSTGEDGGCTDDVQRFKKKRPRTAFSVPQIRTLENEFERNRYLTGSKRKELSRQLKLSETQIKIWFQNRRTKLKRKNVSDMESWVQQLYSPLGPMAPRPLVVGDQLYLFRNPSATEPRIAHVPALAWSNEYSW